MLPKKAILDCINEIIQRSGVMAYNRMTYTIDSSMQFPLVEIDLDMGESVFLQKGSMVYHTPSVSLNTKLNGRDRKSTRLNSSHANISYAVFCLKKKK